GPKVNPRGLTSPVANTVATAEPRECEGALAVAGTLMSAPHTSAAAIDTMNTIRRDLLVRRIIRLLPAFEVATGRGKLPALFRYCLMHEVHHVWQAASIGTPLRRLGLANKRILRRDRRDFNRTFYS